MNDPDWNRITTKAEYLEKCADRYYGEDDGQSIALRHGQLHGYFAGQRLHGTWDWEDDFFTRTSMIGDIDLGFDRIVIDINDTQMRLTLNEGAGDVVVYDRKDAPPADSMQAGEIAVCSSFDIKPDGIDAYIDAMRENQQQVRSEDGNVEMRFFQEITNPTSFYLFGRTVAGSIDDHSANVEDRGIENLVAPTINTPPVVRMLGATDQGTDFGPRDRGVTQQELIVIALFDLKPGYRERVLAQYDKQIPAVRAEPTSVLFNVFTIEDEPDKLVVYERWASQDIGQDFQQRPLSIETGALLAEAVISDLPSSIHPLREIDPYFAA